MLDLFLKDQKLNPKLRPDRIYGDLLSILEELEARENFQWDWAFTDETATFSIYWDGWQISTKGTKRDEVGLDIAVKCLNDWNTHVKNIHNSGTRNNPGFLRLDQREASDLGEEVRADGTFPLDGRSNPS